MPEWLTDWFQSITLWDFVLFATAVLVVIQFIRTKAWRGLKAFARTIIRLDQVFDAVVQLPELTQSIHHETHTNNGSSIKDAVRRLEQDMTQVKTALGITDDEKEK